MENLQPLSSSQCGELEQLAAAAATMDYTDSISPAQTHGHQEAESHSMGQPSAHGHLAMTHSSRPSPPVSSVPQVISYVDPSYHIPKGHHLIPVRAYDTQTYVQEQPQSIQSLSGSRVVMVATNNCQSSNLQFARPMTHFAVTGIQYQNDQESENNCVQQQSSYHQVLASPNTQILHYTTATDTADPELQEQASPVPFVEGEPSSDSVILKTEDSITRRKPSKRSTKRKSSEENVAKRKQEVATASTPETAEKDFIPEMFPCDQCHNVFESGLDCKQHQREHNLPKRNGLTLELKIEIIKRISSGEKKADMAEEYGVNNSTIKSIMKKSESYLSCWKRGMFNPDSKRLKGPKREDIEEALFSWYKQAMQNETPVSGPILCAKAVDFAKKLGHADFKPTHGWLDRFKKRKKIVFGRGSAKRRREDKVPECLSSILPQMLIDYESNDIFAVELLGLFFRSLPSSVEILKGNRCAGGVKSKERLSLVLCTNMTGSEKFPLLVAGRSESSVVLRNAKSLPVHYILDKNAWLTTDIISSWLLDMDSWFVQQGRKVILLAPPSPIYSHPPKMHAIKFVIMPSGYPSPLRQVAVPFFKRCYRKNILKELVGLASRGRKCPKFYAQHIPFFSCLQLLSNAWQSLTDNVIVSSFQRSGLTKYGVWGMIVPADNPDLVGLEEMFANAVRALEDTPSPETTFEDFVHFDNDTQVCNLMGDDDILAKVKGAQEEDDTSEDENENGKENGAEKTDGVRPSFTEVENALSVLRRYIQYQEGAQEMFRVLAHLEYFIYRKLPDPPATNQLLH